MTDSTTRSEEFQFSGDTLLSKIKEILREGNIRRVVIKNEDGRVLIDIPLTIGVVGTLLAAVHARGVRAGRACDPSVHSSHSRALRLRGRSSQRRCPWMSTCSRLLTTCRR